MSTISSASRERYRFDWAWGPLTAFALWWPAHIRGPLDGAPLDRPLEALLLGLLFPVLWWFHPAFLRKPAAQALIAILLLLKTTTLLAAPAGWCVRFDPAAPLVRDSTGRLHSWDVRADWLSPDPQCSALMTRGYDEFKHFPVWFYNLPPIDDGWPSANDRPPYVTLPMSVIGFLDTSSNGVLEIGTGPGMDLNVSVDDRQYAPIDPLSYRIELGPGTHLIEINGALTGNRWRLSPRWNGTPMASLFFPTATVTPPSTVDRVGRVGFRAIGLLLPAIVIGWWTISAAIAWGHAASLAWAVVAAACLAYIGNREFASIVTSPIARWSITALAFSLLIRMPERLRSTRGAFLLIGMPWLAFIAGAFAGNIGRFSFYTGGEDSWMYQRYAYSIYLQGNWLQGGSPAFYFQPLYRWTNGALHLLFGDSSVGEFYADGICLLAAALFVYRVVRSIAGHAWGLAGAVLLLTIVMQGPTFGFLGRGLTDISSAGLIYMSALLALNRRPDGSFERNAIAGAAVLAALAFYTRLNNLPVALSIAALAIPLTVPASAAWHPAQVLRRTSWKLMFGVVAVLSGALFLFALRTWRYTGVFSITHGTSFGMNRVWQPDLSYAVGFQRMLESFGVLLTLSDPPQLSLYAIPLLLAAAATVAAFAGVKGPRDLPLPVLLLFLGGCSSATVVRGIAYPGRYSTHLLGAGCAIAVLVIAMTVNRALRRAPPPAVES